MVVKWREEIDEREISAFGEARLLEREMRRLWSAANITEQFFYFGFVKMEVFPVCDCGRGFGSQ
jgi:hypothetical protein